MKQPDTAALRERLANYTPEDELEQDRQELEGLLQEINCQLIEFRNLLKEKCLGCGKGQCGQYRGRHQPCHCQGGTAHRHPCQNRHR